MMLFRSARQSDLDHIYKLAQKSGIGLTTLPKNKELLAKRINWAVESFSKSIQQPNYEYYLFVLEDSNTGEIVGTSAIESFLGYESPFYSYKLSTRTRISHSLNVRADYEVLNLVNDKQGTSEICTLYLNPNFRHNNNGLLLSKARFLFMAHYPRRFSPTIIAEMRGISTELGDSPFWDAICSHFFKMSFPQADELSLSTNKQFIADLMPRNPIYVKLLPQEAQAVIGKPHASTLPAMKILQREGFRYNEYIDIFDGGPTMEAPRDDIRSVSCSRAMVVDSISSDIRSKRFIISNTSLSFRATLSPAAINMKDNTCSIPPETAETLKLQPGDCLRLVPLHIDEHAMFNED